ncbi:MAG: RagB/SusD family nutrient uptake outer membrane protein [Mangrovibacterium sp.]
MKKIIFIFVSLSSLVISSCSLNTKPEDFIAPEYYYNTEGQCNLALTAIYDKMNYQYATQLCTNFDTADEMWAGGTTNQTWLNDFYSNNSDVVSLWQRLYDGIERANMLLSNIDDVQMSEEIRKVIKGEAKFLRAYYYFMLVQNFGDVPLKTTPTASASDVYYPRTPASEVYDFIYNEMVEAEGTVRPITDYAYAERVSQSAVQGMLARVCLYMAGFPNNKTEKYQDALKWSEKLIQSGLHSLNPDYSQVFINLIQDKYDTNESIWEIGFRTTGATDSYYEFGEMGNTNGIAQNMPEYGMSTGSYRVQQYLWMKYEPGDTRRDWAIAPFYYKSNTSEKVFIDNSAVYDRYIGKYRREYELTPAESKQKRANGTNYPLLRYPDVLLMAAEAENEVNGPTAKAHQYLNEVRTRAHAPIYTGISGKDEFRTIIQDERSRELCFEGLRKMDLKRWGIMIPVMKALSVYIKATYTNATSKERASKACDNVSEQHYYFPIPQREMNLNKLLTQNPGW